jgi:hypothetical protein
MAMTCSVDVDNVDNVHGQMNSGENELDEGDDEIPGTCTQVFLVAYLFECMALCSLRS